MQLNTRTKLCSLVATCTQMIGTRLYDTVEATHKLFGVLMILLVINESLLIHSRNFNQQQMKYQTQ